MAVAVWERNSSQRHAVSRVVVLAVAQLVLNQISARESDPAWVAHRAETVRATYRKDIA
jgi:hypothetical protein